MMAGGVAPISVPFDRPWQPSPRVLMTAARRPEARP